MLYITLHFFFRFFFLILTKNCFLILWFWIRSQTAPTEVTCECRSSLTIRLSSLCNIVEPNPTQQSQTQEQLKGNHLTSLEFRADDSVKPQTEGSTIDCQWKSALFLSGSHFWYHQLIQLLNFPQIRAWTWAWSSNCVSSSVWTPAGWARKPAWTDLSVLQARAAAAAAGSQHEENHSGRSTSDWQRRQKHRQLRGRGHPRLAPYHHGGPHTELKPSSGKLEAEQQQEIVDKTSGTVFFFYFNTHWSFSVKTVF